MFSITILFALLTFSFGAYIPNDFPLENIPIPNIDANDFSVLNYLITVYVHRLPYPWQKVPILSHLTFSFSLALFDSWSHYHPTAEGYLITTGPHRRPASEFTPRNKNVAMLYAIYYAFYNWEDGRYRKNTQDVMTALKLDYTLVSTDLTTPAGIGRMVGLAVEDFSLNDGMNRGGDYRRNTNFQPYEDWTNYFPVNAPWPTPSTDKELLKFPGRHTPTMSKNVFGTLYGSPSVAPQIAFKTRLIPEFNFSEHPVDPPYYYGTPEFDAQVEAVIQASASLTQEQKIYAEFFDDKIRGFGLFSIGVGFKRKLDLDTFVPYDFARDLAQFESINAVWWYKRHFDTVRPDVAIKYSKHYQTIRAWGGPNKGTIDMAGVDWESYLPTDSHSEHPSGTTCACQAVSKMWSLYLKTDALDETVTFGVGFSVIETGKPTSPLNISFSSWTDWANKCAQSRVWAGVHFPKSTQSLREVCRDIGVATYQSVMDHLDGKGNKLTRVPKPGIGGLPIGNLAGIPEWCSSAPVLRFNFNLAFFLANLFVQMFLW